MKYQLIPTYIKSTIKINIIICLSLFCVVASCKEKHKDSNEFEGASQIIKPLEKDEILPSSFLDSVSYIPLDSKNFITHISELQYKNNRYYIVDDISKKLAVFDSVGHALFEIDAVGRGPGEYTEIQDFYVTDEHIVILSRELKKIITYDLEGIVLEDVYIDDYIDGLRPIGSGYITYSTIGIRSSKDERPPGITELVLSPEKHINKPLQVFGGSYAQYETHQHIHFTEGNDGSYLLLNPSDTIFSYKDDSLRVKYILDFGKKNIPKKHKELVNPPHNSEFPYREGYILNKDYLVETDDFVFLKFGYGMYRHNLVYDKRRNKSFSSQYFGYEVSDISDLLYYSFPIFKKNDKHVVSVIYRESFEYILKRLEGNKDSREYRKTVLGGELEYNQYVKKLEELVENGNPVLAIGHLKQY